jgi:hypothetical protein
VAPLKLSKFPPITTCGSPEYALNTVESQAIKNAAQDIETEIDDDKMGGAPNDEAVKERTEAGFRTL